MPFAPSDFRTTMARFASGVTVVTTALDSHYYGLTVNAFCSVSLDPPLVLVSLDLRSQTYPLIRQSGTFAINILAQNQQDLATRFARKDLQSKTFDDISLLPGEYGAPLFRGSVAWIECRVFSEYPGGDHALLLGEVLNIAYQDEAPVCEPLLYYRSNFRAIQPEKVVLDQPQPVLAAALAGPTHRDEENMTEAFSLHSIGEIPFLIDLFSFETWQPLGD
jgi:flavin reductase (DIM6/NTAB) family NADH-FMN oxidoreductase RutF